MTYTRKEQERYRSHLGREFAKFVDAVERSAHWPAIKGLLGSLAHGRYEGEPAAHESKERVCEGIGFLLGTRSALIGLARHAGWRDIDNAACDINTTRPKAEAPR